MGEAWRVVVLRGYCGGTAFDEVEPHRAAVLLDHNMFSGIADAGVVPDPIDEALARMAKSSSDTYVFEMKLDDARVWIEDALNKPTLAPETDTWPLSSTRWGRATNGKF